MAAEARDSHDVDALYAFGNRFVVVLVLRDEEGAVKQELLTGIHRSRKAAMDS